MLRALSRAFSIPNAPGCPPTSSLQIFCSPFLRPFVERGASILSGCPSNCHQRSSTNLFSRKCPSGSALKTLPHYELPCIIIPPKSFLLSPKPPAFASRRKTSDAIFPGGTLSESWGCALPSKAPPTRALLWEEIPSKNWLFPWEKDGASGNLRGDYYMGVS